MTKHFKNFVLFPALALCSFGLLSTHPAKTTAQESASKDAIQWGHWRGPSGNGKSDTAKPPKEFGPTQALRWKVPIPGQGSGSPVIWDQKVFVT
ncbi:MAG: hypothetical protein ACKOOI_17085, partial [Pirellula sp.]